MGGQRKALIIANDHCEHQALRNLRGPAADAEELRRVLGDPQIGDFVVQVVRNEPSHVIHAEIEEIFSESRRDDVLLLHFSGHGLKNESGELFFAAANTRPDRLGSTAVSADFVQRCMRASRSRSVVLLLDCCYGGAFAQGVTVRATGDVNVLDSFPQGRLGGGRGRAVITASSAMEYAFEGDQLTGDLHPRPSVFTTALVEGLDTGEADRDEDGWVSLGELYDYVFDKVREQNPHQTPSRHIELEGELYLARSRRRRIRAAPIPPDLKTAIADPNMYTRLGAVGELQIRLASDDLPVAAGAYEALAELARTDIGYVADAATAALRGATLRPAQTQLHFGRVEQGSAPPGRRVQMLGPPIARTCTARPSHDWIHVDQAAGSLDISIDTVGTGNLQGSVALKGPAGEAAIAIAIDLVATSRRASASSSSTAPADMPVPHHTTPILPAEGQPATHPSHEPRLAAQPRAEARSESQQSASTPAPDRDLRETPPVGQAGSDISDDGKTAESHAGSAQPGVRRTDAHRRRRTRSRLRSPILLSAVLAGLVALAVVAGLLLTRVPGSQRSSVVSYSFAKYRYDDGLVVVRRWTLGGRAGSLFTETITATSASGRALHVPFEEPIPGAIATYLKTARFTPPTAEIMRRARILKWELTVPAHATVTVSYRATVAPAGLRKARLNEWAKDFNRQMDALNNRSIRLRSLTISPQTLKVAPGQAIHLGLSGVRSDGTSASAADLSMAIWSTDNPAVAIVNSLGVVTGVGPGATKVTAQLGDKSASITVAVGSTTCCSPTPSATGPPPSQTTSPSPSTSTFTSPSPSSSPSS